jgi:hypothetical protein
MFDALLCQNWLFSSPNRLTLQITLLYDEKKKSVHPYLTKSSCNETPHRLLSIIISMFLCMWCSLLRDFES